MPRHSCALTSARRAAQAELADAPLPYCAFNGGNDVFVDVGNKSLGLQALQRHLRMRPEEMLHVGDRFTNTGNDNQARRPLPLFPPAVQPVARGCGVGQSP